MLDGNAELVYNDLVPTRETKQKRVTERRKIKNLQESSKNHLTSFGTLV